MGLPGFGADGELAEQLFLGGTEFCGRKRQGLELDDFLVDGGQTPVQVGLVATQADGHDAGLRIRGIGDFDAVDPAVPFAQDAAENGIGGRSAEDVAQQVGRQPFLFFVKGRGKTSDDGIHLVVFLVDGLFEAVPGRQLDISRLEAGQRLPVRGAFKPFPDEADDFFFQFFLREVRHQGEDHDFRTELLGDESSQFLRLDFADGSNRAEDRPGEGMAGEQFLFEPVVYIVGRTVFVGKDLFDDYTAFRLDLGLREGRLGRQFEKQVAGFAQVFLEDGGVDDDFFLGGIGVQLAAQPLEAIVDGGGALAARPFEEGVFGKMGDTGMESGFVPGPAADAEGAVGGGITAATDGIADAAGSFSDDHQRGLTRSFRSDLSRPAPVLPLILCCLYQRISWVRAST